MRRRRFLLAGVLLAAAVLAPASASADVQPRIVGGGTATTATYPWQAAVVFSSAKVSGNAHQRQFCGGSLLTSRIVITAGHCLWDTDPDPGCIPLLCTASQLHLEADDVKVILGHDTLSTTPASAEMPVSAVYWDPNFDPNFGADGVPRYDVGYLVLGSASGQGQIKIAGTDEGALWDPGSYAEISGWGSTSQSSGTVDTLRAAGVTIFDDPTCAADYPGDFDAATMLCAGSSTGGVDTCFGDSGGPLEAPLEGGGYRLVGITGWGIGCGQAGHPGVYTRVAGATMRSLIQADVVNLEATYGLPPEGIFGSGGLPRGTVIAQPKAAPKANARRKCKRIHNKKKRRRCIRKHKHKRK
jgi:secreted trypsin-like serine protease